MIINPTIKQLKTLKMIIYLFTNKIDGKQYVGQTVNTFKRRYKKTWHKYTNNYLKHALIKYGQENFHISILEYDIKDIDEIDRLETFYIERLNTLVPNGYNLENGGQKHKRVHKTTKKKYSEINAKKYIIKEIFNQKIIKIKNLSKFCRKNNLSVQNMWSMIKGRTMTAHNYCLPQITIEKIVNAKNIRYKRHLQKEKVLYSPDNIKHVFVCVKDFCKKHNLNESNIYCLINGSKKVYKGWRVYLGAKFEPRKRRQMFYKKYQEIVLFDLNQNKEIIVNDIRKFSESIGGLPGAFYPLLNGKTNKYKNYTLINTVCYRKQLH